METILMIVILAALAFVSMANSLGAYSGKRLL